MIYHFNHCHCHYHHLSNYCSRTFFFSSFPVQFNDFAYYLYNTPNILMIFMKILLFLLFFWTSSLLPFLFYLFIYFRLSSCIIPHFLSPLVFSSLLSTSLLFLYLLSSLFIHSSLFPPPHLRFYSLCGNYPRALKLFIQCGDREIDAAIEVVGKSQSDGLAHQLIGTYVSLMYLTSHVIVCTFCMIFIIYESYANHCIEPSLLQTILIVLKF